VRYRDITCRDLHGADSPLQNHDFSSGFTTHLGFYHKLITFDRSNVVNFQGAPACCGREGGRDQAACRQSEGVAGTRRHVAALRHTAAAAASLPRADWVFPAGSQEACRRTRAAASVGRPGRAAAGAPTAAQSMQCQRAPITTGAAKANSSCRRASPRTGLIPCRPAAQV